MEAHTQRFGGDWIRLAFYDHANVLVFATPDLGAVDALDGTRTGAVVPGGVLRPGRVYIGELTFARARPQPSAIFPGAEVAIHGASALHFVVRTSGVPRRAEMIAESVEPGKSAMALEIRGESGITLDLETSENLIVWDRFDSHHFEPGDDPKHFEFDSTSRYQFLRIQEGGIHGEGE